ncbi:MAG: DUF2807 domain-containing protein [Alphaproteobacteria bacterium]|nr:MAG: DUF2807 domain-containing protein [Alphaproteobacteria bacterium]
MKTISSLLCVAAMAATSGCVMTEPTESRTFSLTGFDAIDASGGVNLVLKQGPYSIRAEGPKSKLDKLVVEQQGSTLLVRREPMGMSWFGVSTPDLVTVTAPGYTAIHATGGADVEASGLTQPALTLRTSGGADFDATSFRIDQLNIESSGGSDVRISGACKSATISASGGADVEGKSFACETATVTASAGSDVEINASIQATGDASSGADIRFFGAPATFNKTESSGGDVELQSR